MEKINRIITLILSGIVVVFVVPLLCFIVSSYIDAMLLIPNFVIIPLNIIIGILFIILGIFFAAWANYTLFTEGEGTPVPLEGTQTKKLVTTGPYKYSRNPMIFGYINYWIGLGFILNSFFFTTGFTIIVSFFLYLFVSGWEEENLEKRFGEEYLEYKNNVSAIIPFPFKKKKN